MDEDLTVGTLGIDVEINTSEFESVSGAELERAAVRSGRRAGRAMGDAMREEAERASAAAADTAPPSRTRILTGDPKADARRMMESIRAELEAKAPDAVRPITTALSDAGEEGATTFIGHMRDIFRRSAREAQGLVQQVTGVTVSMRGLVGIAGTLLGVLLAISGIKALFRFANEAKELALETENASDRLQVLQDAVAGKADRWREFKIAVGTAMLELQGVQRTSDVMGAVLRGLTRFIDDNSGAWRQFGRVVATAIEGLLRLGGIIAAAVLGPLSLLVQGLALLDKGYAAALSGGERFRAWLGRRDVDDSVMQEVARIRRDAAELRKLGQDMHEMGRSAARAAVFGFGALPANTGSGATTQREQEEAAEAAREAARRAQEQAREAQRRAQEAAQEAARRAAERLRLEEQLQQQLAQLTRSGTDIALAELDRLIAAYRAAGGAVTGEFAQQAGRLRELLQAQGALGDLGDELSRLMDAKPSTTTLDALDALADRAGAYREQVAGSLPLTEQLEELLRRIAEHRSEIEAQALTADLRSVFDSEMAGLREQLAGGLIDQKQFERQGRAAAETFTRAFNARLLERIRALRAAGLGKEADELARALDVSTRPDKTRDIREQARALEETVRAATQLAVAFGLIDENAAQAFQGVAQLAGAVQRVAASLEGGFDAKTFDFGALTSGLGALAMLGNAIFGESAMDRERRQALDQNTEALRRLAAELEGFRVTGDVLGRVGTGLTDAGLARWLGALDALDFSDLGTRGFEQSLQAAGLSLRELENLAAEAGITIRDSAGRFIAEGLLDLQEYIRMQRQLMVGFLPTPTSQRERSDLEAAVFDRPTDPASQLQRDLGIARQFMDPGVFAPVSGADPSTPEGRAMIEAWTRAAFTAFATDPNFQLGGLTRDEFLELLRSMDISLDELAEQAGESATPRAFQISRTITETTAERMIGALSTIAALVGEYNRAIALNTAGILAALTGGALPSAERLAMPSIPEGSLRSGSASAASAGASFSVGTLEVYVTAASGEDPYQTGVRIGEGVRDSLREIDQGLGATTINRYRAAGRPTEYTR